MQNKTSVTAHGKNNLFFCRLCWEDLWTLLDSISNGTLEESSMMLKEMVPPPMHSMLEKESRESAIEKHIARKAMVTVEAPPTTPG